MVRMVISRLIEGRGVFPSRGSIAVLLLLLMVMVTCRTSSVLRIIV